jgi:hypothetical protein
MTRPELRFFAEYQCYPTWVTQPGGGEDNPDPHDLGLPDDLADAVIAWSDDFDALFDEEDFGAPLFSSDEEEASFDARGRTLAEQVAVHLRDRFEVRYHGLADQTWVTLG